MEGGFQVWDVDAGRFIDSKLAAVTGEGQLLLKDSEDSPWRESDKKFDIVASK